MIAKVRINPTRQRRYYKCEYDWFAYSHLGIEKIKPIDSPHRDRGKAFHALVEFAFRRFAETNAPFTFAGDDGQLLARTVLYDLYKREGTSLDEETSLSLLAGTRYQLERFDMAAWEVVRLADGTPLIETDLRWDGLCEGVEVQAKIDLCLRRRASGKVWLIDLKSTFKPIDTLDVPPFLEHDDQLAMQRAVLAAAGVKVDYCALLHMRTVAPQEPPLVYKGKKNERTTLSLDSIACDWETYRATLEKRGEDPNSTSALAVRDGLAGQTFMRWQTDITSKLGEQAMQANLRRVAERMLAFVEERDVPIRRLNQAKFDGCERCDYAAWCRAAMRNGGEPDLALLGTDYRARDHSPLAGQERYDVPLFRPADAYVKWAAEHGQPIQAHEEFKP